MDIFYFICGIFCALLLLGMPAALVEEMVNNAIKRSDMQTSNLQWNYLRLPLWEIFLFFIPDIIQITTDAPICSGLLFLIAVCCYFLLPLPANNSSRLSITTIWLFIASGMAAFFSPVYRDLLVMLGMPSLLTCVAGLGPRSKEFSSDESNDSCDFTYDQHTVYDTKYYEQQRAEVERQIKERNDRVIHNLIMICSGVTILDTCVWMEKSPDAAKFFASLIKICKLNKHEILLPATVYEEITKHCNSCDKEKSYAGREAKRRIELFSEAGCLTSDRNWRYNFSAQQSYADPVIIKLAEEFSRHGDICYIITLDRDLRIRGREYLRAIDEKENFQNIAIFLSLDDLFQKDIDS